MADMRKTGQEAQNAGPVAPAYGAEIVSFGSRCCLLLWNDSFLRMLSQGRFPTRSGAAPVNPRG